MKRRTFVKSAGAAAGALISGEKSGRAQSNSPIQHVVVVMMENRSFDHILGWLPGANGMQAGLSYKDSNGNPQQTFELATDYTGCTYPDPDHSYQGGRTEYDGGLMDGFLQVQPGSLYPIGYYQEKDLPFRSALARNYLTCDNYFPSILAPTFPNRIFQHAGQTDRLDDSLTISTLPTIWDHLATSGISHRYYFSNVPFLALWGLKYLNISSPYAQFLADCAAGTLPAVSFVDPSFTLLLNLAEDDHPHSDVRNGDAFMAKTFHAVSSSPVWPSTALIFNYDEWGGFFDHVVPPRAVAPNNVDTDLVDGKALLGIRVPCIVASPWTLGNVASPEVDSTIFDHTSVLKLIESVWNVPYLAAREESSDVGNLLEVFDFSSPSSTVPALPSPGFVVPSSICESDIVSSRPDSEANVFQHMVDSGMLKAWPGY
jgi:phospholipase C